MNFRGPLLLLRILWLHSMFLDMFSALRAVLNRMLSEHKPSLLLYLAQLFCGQKWSDQPFDNFCDMQNLNKKRRWGNFLSVDCCTNPSWSLAHFLYQWRSGTLALSGYERSRMQVRLGIKCLLVASCLRLFFWCVWKWKAPGYKMHSRVDLRWCYQSHSVLVRNPQEVGSSHCSLVFPNRMNRAPAWIQMLNATFGKSSVRKCRTNAPWYSHLTGTAGLASFSVSGSSRDMKRSILQILADPERISRHWVVTAVWG